jgi:NADH-quinone oxidoreductase subunit C
MTTALSGSDIAERLKEQFAEAITEVGDDSITIKSQSLPDIASFLKDTSGLDFDYLDFIAGVDYREYFELVYYLASLKHNHSLIIKTRCYDRGEPTVPSVTGLWPGADFQEREIFDLLGIKFNGHPNMKRIFLWSGFDGHPLRKDFKNGT